MNFETVNQYKKYTFFYKARNPFSNWYSCNFTDEERTVYNCSEQYMMAEKARLFGDETTREEILMTTHPRDQQYLGRKVKNFDSTKWEENCKEIVYKGCYLKFTQNPKILSILESTKGTLLVEASPYDRIWGIGLGENDSRIHNPKNWRGTNWLGIVLTKLRDDIFKK